MFVSVLICTRNRSKSLRRTLDSLFCASNLSAPDWEVIVVEYKSTDDTGEICRQWMRKLPTHLKFLSEERPGKSNAMNTAFAAARGDILAMTDDDVVVAPDYVQAIRMVFNQYRADGAQGRILLDCEGGRPAWMDDRMALFMSLQDHGDQVLEWNRDMSGTNMVVRTEIARKVGGFAPQLGAGTEVGFAEDTEFSFRLLRAGSRLIYAPQILVRHQIPRERLTRAFFRKRYFGRGRSLAYLESPPGPLWRVGIYVAKELVLGELKAAWHLCAGRPAQALRFQCDARQQAGFLWQHWHFKRGMPPQPFAPQRRDGN